MVGTCKRRAAPSLAPWSQERKRMSACISWPRHCDRPPRTCFRVRRSRIRLPPRGRFQRQEGNVAGIYIIGPRTAEVPQAVIPQAVVPPAIVPVRAGEPKITMDLINVPAREATELLFSKTGYQFAIQPNVPKIPVTMRLREIHFTTALRTLVRLVGATYIKDGSIYMITARQSPDGAAPRAEPVP